MRSSGSVHRRPLLETERLVLAEVTPELLPELLQVFTSNPFYVGMTEGPDGYDLPKLQRDWQLAAATPGRHMWAICRKDDGAAVGMVDFLEENPSDRVPWIGLLIIRGELQGQGYGTEALGTLFDHFRRDRGWTTVRIGVIARNTPALRWWQRRGFQPIGTVCRRLPAGDCEIVRMEWRLDATARPRRASRPRTGQRGRRLAPIVGSIISGRDPGDWRRTLLAAAHWPSLQNLEVGCRAPSRARGSR